MSLGIFNQKVLEPLAQWLMVAGIICLCQPWVAALHQWSVAMMLLGLVAFNVAAHIAPPPPDVDEDDTGPVSVTETVRDAHGHG